MQRLPAIEFLYLNMAAALDSSTELSSLMKILLNKSENLSLSTFLFLSKSPLSSYRPLFSVELLLLLLSEKFLFPTENFNFLFNYNIFEDVYNLKFNYLYKLS